MFVLVCAQALAEIKREKRDTNFYMRLHIVDKNAELMNERVIYLTATEIAWSKTMLASLSHWLYPTPGLTVYTVCNTCGCIQLWPAPCLEELPGKKSLGVDHPLASGFLIPRAK